MKKFICLFAAFACLSVDAQQDWELIHDTKTDLGMEYVFMYDTNHIWGMFQNDVYFSPDGGYSWDLQFEHDGNYYTDIQFVDSLTGYFVAWSHIYKTVDGGNEWNLVYHNIHGISYTTLYFINQDTGWVAGDYQNICVTYNGGQSWTTQHIFNLQGSYDLHDIHFFDAMHGCAVGGDMVENDPYILTTSDGGENWTENFPEGNDIWIKVQFVSQNQVWSCNRGDDIFRSNDAGYNWQTVASLGVNCMEDLYFFDDSNAIAIPGCRSYHCITTDAWNSWEELQLYSNNVVDKVSFIDQNTGIGVGYGGHVLRTNDGGYTWKRLNEQFNAIGFFTPMNGWVIQAWMSKNFMHTTDGGFTWNEVETGHSGFLVTMDIVSDQIGFALTSQDEILKTVDAGASWQIIETDLDTISSDIQFLDENIGFMCAMPSAFYKTINGGNNWVSYSFDTVNALRDLDFISEYEGWIIGTPGFLAHTIDGGTSWVTSTSPGNNLNDIEFVNDHKGFIVTYHGFVFMTNNAGADWEQIDIDISSPDHVDFIDSLHGWISGYGQLFYTNDGGEYWNEVLNLQISEDDRMINDVFAIDSTNAWLCTANGRIFSCADLVGIEEDRSVSDIKIFPNPVKDQLQIVFNDPGNKYSNLRIFSIEGKLLLVKDLAGFKEEKISLDLSDFSPGIYFLNLQGTYNSSCVKVIKN